MDLLKIKKPTDCIKKYSIHSFEKLQNKTTKNMQYQLGIHLPSEYNDNLLINLGINSNFIIKGPFDSLIYADRISGLIGSNHCHSCHKSSSDDECSSHSRDKRMAVFEEMDCVQVNHDESSIDSDSDSSSDSEEECHEECDQENCKEECDQENCKEECVLKSSSDCCELKNEKEEMRKSKKVSHRPTKVDKYLKEASSKRKQIKDIVDSVDLKSDDTAVERTVSKKKQKLDSLDANFEKNINELKKKISVMSHSSEKNQ